MGHSFAAEIKDLIKYKTQVQEADLTICIHRKLNEPSETILRSALPFAKIYGWSKTKGELEVSIKITAYLVQTKADQKKDKGPGK